MFFFDLVLLLKFFGKGNPFSVFDLAFSNYSVWFCYCIFYIFHWFMYAEKLVLWMLLRVLSSFFCCSCEWVFLEALKCWFFLVFQTDGLMLTQFFFLVFTFIVFLLFAGFLGLTVCGWKFWFGSYSFWLEILVFWLCVQIFYETVVCFLQCRRGNVGGKIGEI